MGVVQLNQIKTHVLRVFESLVDVSDVMSGEEETARLTRGLAAWVIMQLTGSTAEIAANSVTDGFDDNGIDAIAVDEENSVVYLVQAKWNHAGKGSPAVGDVHKFIQGFRDIINAEFGRFNQKVRSKEPELEAALGDHNIRFVLIIAHTGQQSLSSHAEAAISGLLDEINDPMDTATLETFTQADLHGFLRRGVHGVSPDLRVTLYDWGATQEPYAAYYGQVEASAVASWFTDHGTQLFSKNIRQFLGHDFEVNASIIDTLLNKPQHFWYLNNGITVLCERVAKNPLGGTSKKVGHFEFHRVSVVNGAQTVGCIGKAMSDHPEAIADARVMIRFISLENCPPEFAGEVTRGTNTQNRVERRDFVALDPQQARLATELAIDGIRYAIKSGESTPAPESGCTVVDATVALACAKGTPDLAVQAKREIGRLWVGAEGGNPQSQYRQLFNSGVTSLQLWRAVQILRGIEQSLSNELADRHGRDKLIGVHGNRLIAHQVFQRLSPEALTDPSFDLSTALGNIPRLVRKVYDANVEIINTHYGSNYLASLFKNVTRCRDVVNRASQLMGAS